jgi:hypothetical protein
MGAIEIARQFFVCSAGFSLSDEATQFRARPEQAKARCGDMGDGPMRGHRLRSCCSIGGFPRLCRGKYRLFWERVGASFGPLWRVFNPSLNFVRRWASVGRPASNGCADSKASVGQDSVIDLADLNTRPIAQPVGGSKRLLKSVANIDPGEQRKSTPVFANAIMVRTCPKCAPSPTGWIAWDGHGAGASDRVAAPRCPNPLCSLPQHPTIFGQWISRVGSVPAMAGESMP